MSNTITTSSYGFFIFSLSNFIGFLKKKNIKKRNLLDVFDKNKELFSDLCLKEKIAIPLIKVTNTTYKIYVNQDGLEQLGSNWEEVFNHKNFALNVGNDGFWIASFEFFEDWNVSIFNTDKSFIGQEIATGSTREKVFYNKALHYNITSGLKKVSIKGHRNSNANPKRLSNEICYEINLEHSEDTSFENPFKKDFNLEF